MTAATHSTAVAIIRMPSTTYTIQPICFAFSFSGGPCKGKKLWQAVLVFLVLPRRDRVGNKLIVFRFFVYDAQTRARHRHDNFAACYFDDNFWPSDPV